MKDMRSLPAVSRPWGVDAAVAEEDACKIEHVISEESFQAIKDHISKMKDK